MKDSKHEQQINGIPINLAMPARRALKGAGYTHLEQLTEVSAAELKQPHGMGPKAIDQVRSALGACGLSFAGSKQREAGD